MESMVDLILHKREGGAFTRAQIDTWVRGAAQGTVPDYQLAALLMAICLRGMTAEETRDLTLSMAESGRMADLSGVGGVCVDKHSHRRRGRYDHAGAGAPGSGLRRKGGQDERPRAGPYGRHH